MQQLNKNIGYTSNDVQMWKETVGAIYKNSSQQTPTNPLAHLNMINSYLINGNKTINDIVSKSGSKDDLGDEMLSSLKKNGKEAFTDFFKSLSAGPEAAATSAFKDFSFGFLSDTLTDIFFGPPAESETDKKLDKVLDKLKDISDTLDVMKLRMKVQDERTKLTVDAANHKPLNEIDDKIDCLKTDMQDIKNRIDDYFACYTFQTDVKETTPFRQIVGAGGFLDSLDDYMNQINGMFVTDQLTPESTLQYALETKINLATEFENGCGRNFFSNQNCYGLIQLYYSHLTSLQLYALQTRNILNTFMFGYMWNCQAIEKSINLPAGLYTDYLRVAKDDFDKWSIYGAGQKNGSQPYILQQRTALRTHFKDYYNNFQGYTGPLPDDIAIGLIPAIDQQEADIFYSKEATCLVFSKISYLIRDWFATNVVSQQITRSEPQNWNLPTALKEIFRFPTYAELKCILGEGYISGIAAQNFKGDYYSYLESQGFIDDFDSYPIDAPDANKYCYIFVNELTNFPDQNWSVKYRNRYDITLHEEDNDSPMAPLGAEPNFFGEYTRDHFESEGAADIANPDTNCWFRFPSPTAKQLPASARLQSNGVINFDFASLGQDCARSIHALDVNIYSSYWDPYTGGFDYCFNKINGGLLIAPIMPYTEPTDQPKPFNIRFFSNSLTIDAPPEGTAATIPGYTVKATVPLGYKLISGGGFAETEEDIYYLSGTYPEMDENGNYNSWAVNGNSNLAEKVPATLNVLAIGIYDPDHQLDVNIALSDPTAVYTPANQSRASLSDDYLMTGGGAKVDTKNNSIHYLTVCGPVDDEWVSFAQSTSGSHDADITTFAIGVKWKNADLNPIATSINSIDISAADNGTSRQFIPANSEYNLCGGGTVFDGDASSFLIGSFPISGGWVIISSSSQGGVSSSISVKIPETIS